jgi:hypothetical protein
MAQEAEHQPSKWKAWVQIPVSPPQKKFKYTDVNTRTKIMKLLEYNTEIE